MKLVIKKPIDPMTIALTNIESVNKINVLNKKKIKDIFKKNNIILVRGDWTKPNEKINQFLNQYNRFGIPFNVFYSKKYTEGILLSELLSEKEILNNINKINND